MKSKISKRKSDFKKKEPTRSITYRLPLNLVEELEAEANDRSVSQNVLVKQILEKYNQWDRFAEQIGMIPIPKEILITFGKQMSGEDIDRIVTVLHPLIQESTLFMKGKYDLKRCIESLEDYMRASGMKSDHRIEGDVHHFIIQHELGMNWSLLTEQLFKGIFHEFVPNKNMRCQTTKSTVIASIPLGSDFSEHDY